jgi:hypothetical protein
MGISERRFVFDPQLWLPSAPMFSWVYDSIDVEPGGVPGLSPTCDTVDLEGTIYWKIPGGALWG